MNAITETIAETRKYNGELFGYPECCIAEFIKSPIAANRQHAHAIHNSKFWGTGFIPCQNCISKNHIQLLTEIANNRHPDLMPFPNQKWKNYANKNI